MLDKGSRAPAFSLPDADGHPVTLDGLLADGPLILYFYPADFTPGCTREACSIRDLHDDIVAAGLTIVGVSPQDGDSHARFAEKHNLPFALLCDPDKTVIRAYDVDGPLGIGTRRGTYLINADGVIEDAVLADIMIDRHTKFIQNAIRLRAESR